MTLHVKIHPNSCYNTHGIYSKCHSHPCYQWLEVKWNTIKSIASYFHWAYMYMYNKLERNSTLIYVLILLLYYCCYVWNGCYITYDLCYRSWVQNCCTVVFLRGKYSIIIFKPILQYTCTDLITRIREHYHIYYSTKIIFHFTDWHYDNTKFSIQLVNVLLTLSSYFHHKKTD